MAFLNKQLSAVSLQKYLTNPNWDHSNRVLYKMVQDNFYHTEMEQVLTKVLVIGRVYAVALERRRETNGWLNSDFYTKKIWPCFRKMDLDPRIEELKHANLFDEKTISTILGLHGYMLKHLHNLTGHNKRSFVSKYLHFHLPNIFFLYDSRAVNGIKHFPAPAVKLARTIKKKGIDPPYSRFFCRCVDLQTRIKAERNVDLSPRQLDNLLMYS